MMNLSSVTNIISCSTMSYYKGADLLQSIPQFRPNTSIARVLVDALTSNGDANGLVEGHTGKAASFREILEWSSGVAAELRSSGVSVGDYVVVCCEKSIVAYCSVFGAIFTGATVVLPPIPHADIIHKLTRGHVIKAVICDPCYLDTVQQSLSHVSPPCSLVLTTENPVLTSPRRPDGDFRVYEAADIYKHVAMIFFSSGTTGDPKGIQLSDVCVQLCGSYFHHKFRQFLIASPLYWLSAFFPVLSGIFNNFAIVLSNSREPVDNLKMIQQYKIDAWFTSSGSMSRYIYEPTLHRFDLSSVERAFVSGEYVTGSVAENFAKTVLRGRVKLEIVFGATEVGLIQDQIYKGLVIALMISIYNAEQRPGPVKTGECGRLYPGLEMKILDDKGNIVPVGTLGNIWLKSVSMTPGYWGRPDLNSVLLDKDGFFESGDAGFFDKNFNIFHRGRVGDLINYKGVKLAPGETENVLLSHEDVLDGAVVGTPNPTDTQLLMAVVELRPGAKATAQELVTYVNEKMDEQRKIRGGVHIAERLPRTVIGKVIRKQLRQLKAS